VVLPLAVTRPGGQRVVSECIQRRDAELLTSEPIQACRRMLAGFVRWSCLPLAVKRGVALPTSGVLVLLVASAFASVSRS